MFILFFSRALARGSHCWFADDRYDHPVWSASSFLLFQLRPHMQFACRLKIGNTCPGISPDITGSTSSTCDPSEFLGHHTVSLHPHRVHFASAWRVGRVTRKPFARFGRIHFPLAQALPKQLL